MKFEDLTATDRGDITNNRRDITFTASKSTLRTNGYANAPRSSIMPTHVEVPPTAPALDPESFRTLLASTGDDIASTWTRFYLVVYYLGGRIFYRDLSSGDIEAVVRF
jgi:hypothetical protein